MNRILALFVALCFFGIAEQIQAGGVRYTEGSGWNGGFSGGISIQSGLAGGYHRRTARYERMDFGGGWNNWNGYRSGYRYASHVKEAYPVDYYGSGAVYNTYPDYPAESVTVLPPVPMSTVAVPVYAPAVIVSAPTPSSDDGVTMLIGRNWCRYDTATKRWTAISPAYQTVSQAGAPVLQALPAPTGGQLQMPVRMVPATMPPGFPPAPMLVPENFSVPTPQAVQVRLPVQIVPATQPAGLPSAPVIAPVTGEIQN